MVESRDVGEVRGLQGGGVDRIVRAEAVRAHELWRVVAYLAEFDV